MNRTYLNNQAATVSRNLLTGKDGALFNGDGKLLASVEEFTAKLNVKNSNFNPIGDPQEHEGLASYSITLTFTEAVVEDESFTNDIFEFLASGISPKWNFQGVIRHPRTGKEQRVVYRDCIPSGDIIKRSISMFVNAPPELLKFLSA